MPSDPDTNMNHVQINTSSRKRYRDAIALLSLGSERANSLIRQLISFSARHASTAQYLDAWQRHCAAFMDLKTAEAILSDLVLAPEGTRLFVSQAYALTVLRAFSHHTTNGHFKPDFKCSGFFDWTRSIPSEFMDQTQSMMSEALRLTTEIDSTLAGRADFASALYQEIFPPSVRHLLGEYYTPGWLVDYCLEKALQMRALPDAGMRVLDPAVGSGTFLVHFIATILRLPHPPKKISLVGLDVNPVAIEFCRVNVDLALEQVRSRIDVEFSLEVYLSDSVFRPPPIAELPFDQFPTRHVSDIEPGLRNSIGLADHRPIRAFDMIVGNPPWISWDGLSQGYRNQLAEGWASSPLFQAKGWKAKVAAGKTELASLFVYQAADRFAKSQAVMAFVLPLSLFQSHLSGAGFRSFSTESGIHYRLVSLDDMSQLKVFPDAANRVAVAFFNVGEETVFPIPYTTWKPSQGDKIIGADRLARPILADHPSSPIAPMESGNFLVGPSDYRARGGVNTGGANTVFWIEVLENKEGAARIRNLGAGARSRSKIVSGWAEENVISPLLLGRDVKRWTAKPSRYILLCYSPDQPKKAIAELELRDEYPLASAYLDHFREELESRKEYQRWGAVGPFYEVYRIGPYTFSKIKVVWQHTGYRDKLNVCVVDDRAGRATIPDQKVILIAFDDIDAAHYACAYLSSARTSRILNGYLSIDASTHILDYVALRKFDPSNRTHRSLAELSKRAHQCASSEAEIRSIEREIDLLVEDCP
jgi:hypothetical protein